MVGVLHVYVNFIVLRSHCFACGRVIENQLTNQKERRSIHHRLLIFCQAFVEKGSRSIRGQLISQKVLLTIFCRLPLFRNLDSFDRPERDNRVYYTFNYAIFLIILVFASRKSIPCRQDYVTSCVVCVADNVPPINPHKNMVSDNYCCIYVYLVRILKYVCTMPISARWKDDENKNESRPTTSFRAPRPSVNNTRACN